MGKSLDVFFKGRNFIFIQVFLNTMQDKER